MHEKIRVTFEILIFNIIHEENSKEIFIYLFIY